MHEDTERARTITPSLFNLCSLWFLISRNLTAKSLYGDLVNQREHTVQREDINLLSLCVFASSRLRVE